MSFEVKLPPEDIAKLEGLHKPQRGFRPSRRYLVGGLLLILASAVLIRSFVFTSGFNTTLVADMGIVRAPASGIVGTMDADVGDRVRHDQYLGTFGVPVGLSAAVTAASTDIDELRAQIASLDERMGRIRREARTIGDEGGLFRRQKGMQLAARSDQAAADLDRANAQFVFAGEERERARALADKGFLSAAALQKADQNYRAADAERAAAAAQLRASKVEAGAARQGLLLTNGFSDVQYSTQRMSELSLALGELQGQRDSLASALEQARDLTRGVWHAPRRKLQFPLRASVNGRVWAKVALPGESVREGDPIYLLADCSTFYAYFTVGRSTYSSLKMGAPVTFISFAGGDRWPGKIVNMGVSDPSQIRMTGQVLPPAAGDYLIGARISLPAADQKTCPVGTAGRVVL